MLKAYIQHSIIFLRKFDYQIIFLSLEITQEQTIFRIVQNFVFQIGQEN